MAKKKKIDNYLPEVRSQYEALPYPNRDPKNEKKKLIVTLGDNLNCLNHFGYKGRADFSQGYRVLIAGGGTGDSAIYLAEQLKQYPNAAVVYLDMSSASMKIAKERAKIRKLNNITWINDSLLNLPELGLESFDYINCSGVLHHLADPQAGLHAVTSVLKEDGVMLLMLYAPYGRRVVYLMQNLFRRLLSDSMTIKEKVKVARLLLDQLPAGNVHNDIKKRFSSEISKNGMGDPGLYDLLLHSTDRCYSVSEIYDFLDHESLSVLGFLGKLNRYYDIQTLLSPEKYKTLIHTKTTSGSNELFKNIDGTEAHTNPDFRENCIHSEKVFSGLTKHVLFASRKKDSVATLDDESLAIFFTDVMHQKAAEASDSLTPGEPFKLEYQTLDHYEKIEIVATELHKYLIRFFDGKHAISEMVARAKIDCKQTDEAIIRKNLHELFYFFHEMNSCFLCEPNRFYEVR